jgi:hypothetical protein
MKNLKKIQATFTAAGVVRNELNSVHWKRMNSVQRLIANLYDIPLKQVSGLNQFWHYRNGGYPSESSPPRYEVAAEKLANMYLGAECIGKEGLINKYLERVFGLKIIRVAEKPKLKLNKFNKKTNSLFTMLNLSESLTTITNPLKLFKLLLNEMDDIQVKICTLSDKIKYEHFATIKNVLKEDSYKKSTFIKSVAAEAANVKAIVLGKKKKSDLKSEAQIVLELLK